MPVAAAMQGLLKKEVQVKGNGDGLSEVATESACST